MEIKDYFEKIEGEVKKAYDLASKARIKGNDPENYVDIPLAKNIFERVEGLIGAVKPELIGSGLAKRLAELEAKYRSGDWRIALLIAEETARGKFCKFKDEIEAIELGIRVGLAYVTMGVVSAPLEGFIEFKIKDRMDGGKYASCYFAGPIRAAGGTAAAVTLLICDYLRRKFGLQPFDITKDEIGRAQIEIEGYHNTIARLQYYPINEELQLLLSKVPIEINGDPTSEREVLIYKDLPRIGTPRIRGGMCLVLCEGLAQKSKKILKNVENWGKDFGLEDWTFLKEYVELQKKIHSMKQKDAKEDNAKIQPNYVYIDETVAGRPIFSYPMTKGGFRLRYGRTRLTGLAAAAINPATTRVLENFIATGAQLRIERPGKACAVTPCDTIDGPIVKLFDESVVQINTEEDATKYHNKIKEIIFLGDLLFAYGEFVRNNHILVPSPYVEEWWTQELEKAAKEKCIFVPSKIDEVQAIKYSLELGIPLHPQMIFYYSELEPEQILQIYKALESSKIIKDGENYTILLSHDKTLKKSFETIGLPHRISDIGIIIEGTPALGILYSFAILPEKKYDISKIEKMCQEKKTPLEILNAFSKLKIMEKTGIYVGARLGRPEKAKQRKLTGRPQILFPVGTQGGRMRSLNEALAKGFIEADFPAFKCNKCGETGIYPRCETCGTNCRQLKFCIKCKRETEHETHCGTKTTYAQRRRIDVRNVVDKCINKLQVSMPQLIKGVRGTSNKKKIPEPIEKGVLRAIHGVYVNKDGTIRYDAIEAPITHFKPKEVGTSVAKLRELGYTQDICGNELVNENQVLELMPQDVILPDCKDWPDASALDMVYHTAAFVDDLLEKYYNLERYYNIRSPNDMIGQLIIGLAPHTSAGIVGRIVGFSKTQCFFAHPYFHSACRRNCVHPETNLVIYDKNENRVLSQPVGALVENLIEKGMYVKKDNEFYIINAPESWETFSINPESHEIEKKRIRCFLKGPVPKKWIKIRTILGREFVMTPDHTFLYLTEKGFSSKRADGVLVGDIVPLNFRLNPPQSNSNKLNIVNEFLKIDKQKLKDELRITCAEDYFKKIAAKTGIAALRRIINFSKQHQKTLSKWYKRVPLSHFEILLKNSICSIENLPTSAKISMWQTELPAELELSEELMRIIGYYLAEGHARENKWTHQISFRVCDRDVFNDLVRCIKNVFGFVPNTAENSTKANISNKLIYYLFTEVLKTGKSAKTKRVPSLLFNLNKEKLSNFISAYFDGDGSALQKPLRLQFYSTSQNLLNDIGIILSRFGILSRYFEVKPRLPGRKIIERYKELKKEPGYFGLKHLTLGRADAIAFSKICNPKHKIKSRKLQEISCLAAEGRYTKFNGQMVALKEFCDFTTDIIKSVEEIKENKNSYCLDIISDNNITSKNILWGNQLFQIRCDGDELGFMLLMDALLNFSRQYLPDKRGGRAMDAPLVLTTRLNPEEVDDEVYNMDIADKYPLEFYQATQEWKSPYDVSIKQIQNVLGKPGQYSGLLYTHNVENMNSGNRVSAYKSLTTIMDKVQKQMELAERVRAVNKSDVAKILIEKHFLKDIKGNLRKYSKQEFRCISCNQKYRRIPLIGRCDKCAGKLVLTVAEGTVSKYLEPSLDLAEKYFLPKYLHQTLEILRRRVDAVFGREPTKQTGLKKFFG